ncbi:hypothetical protein FNF27_03706 [Cafeteria roenbergensis]|uniref:CSD domain-containing protein n=2 Tax=Cafeteria roenbergensis TaxID=33653 RepID=A0A5A8DQ70_CAFRO|nr:hypothetical protein FNF29_04056 [Cafeteria roenbergensis]KAA0166010.1 hypothetical protein FNF31_01623 [Cafeteria roenbergensis]KAA0169889.1 hypothetical protein FNF28_01826 [Cafeteria roenbergensis]KAA0174810.1 hypothetical protein FNF27_03706 [Cafeteria roenbergensis]|eukprot:KAA0152190.1 hypothetical protein FNF29_04056 [Cafeteria roenbergensis]
MLAARFSSAMRVAVASAQPAAAARAMSTAGGALSGTVQWFNPKKGYGFIVPDEANSTQVFVHHTAIQGTGFRFLNEGEKVEFQLVDTERGQQASNVTGPDGAPLDRAAGERAAPGSDEF